MPISVAGMKELVEKLASNIQCQSFCHAKTAGQTNTTHYILQHDTPWIEIENKLCTHLCQCLRCGNIAECDNISDMEESEKSSDDSYTDLRLLILWVSAVGGSTDYCCSDYIVWRNLLLPNMCSCGLIDCVKLLWRMSRWLPYIPDYSSKFVTQTWRPSFIVMVIAIWKAFC